MRVLVVEDDPGIADVVLRALRENGYAADLAEDGQQALERTELVPYDVVVLDRQLPHLSGDHVCRRLVDARYPARILMLTAASALRDRVDGLDLGADDYLTKPFAVAELLARVRALSRRVNSAAPTILEWRDLQLDPARREVYRGERDVRLTRKEFGVLEQLLRAGGAVVSAEAMLDSVWDERTDPFTNAMRITVMTLRRKLGEPPLIETVIGAGYRMR